MTKEGFELWREKLKSGARFSNRFQENEWSVAWDEKTKNFVLTSTEQVPEIIGTEPTLYYQTTRQEMSEAALFEYMSDFSDETILKLTR